MNIKNHILALFCTVFFTVSVFAQTVSVTLDTADIRIGEQINLHISAKLSAEKSIVFPVVLDTLTGNIDVVSQSKIDTSYDKDNITTKIMSQNLTITSFDSGYFAIPPFQFNFEDSIIYSEPILLQVQTLQIDTAKGIADINEPLQVEYSFVDWFKDNWHWFGIGAIVLAIIALIIYFVKNRKIPEAVPEKIIPSIPPHIVAMQKLTELGNKKLWQAGSTKEYHSELSDIIREYIERRFDIYAMEQTTPEIMKGLRSATISKEMKSKLGRILTLADLVKFAKEKPLSTENEKNLENAILFVNETKIEEIPEKKEPIKTTNNV